MAFPTPYPDYDFSWDIRVYDLDGTELAVLTEAAERRLSMPLNGIDACQFTMYLDDPLIDPTATPPGDPSIIRTIDRVVKVWRTVTDVTDPDLPVEVYADPDGTPAFAGYITRAEKVGGSNTIQVIAQSPLWRLQSRFHLLNHYLVIDYVGQADANHQGGNEDGNPWDISALMFRLIDLVQGAFGGVSNNGILKPATGPPFWPATLEMGPFRVNKGDNTWTLFSTLLDQVGGPDLMPEYIHTASSPDLMYFGTAEHRGTDVSAAVHLDYYMGNFNLDDISELEEVIPDKFSNYDWAVGQGGPNVSVAIAADINTTDMGYDNVGVYMHQIENESISTGVGSVLQDNADAELAKTHVRPSTYSLMISPLTLIYNDSFTLGDIVEVNANKGALQISALKQRIYEVVLSLSDVNVESCDVVVADDFFSKVPLV